MLEQNLCVHIYMLNLGGRWLRVNQKKGPEPKLWWALKTFGLVILGGQRIQNVTTYLLYAVQMTKN